MIIKQCKTETDHLTTQNGNRQLNNTEINTKHIPTPEQYITKTDH